MPSLACDQSDLEWLSGFAQMLEVTAELLVKPSGCQRRHIESGAHGCTASPELSFSLLPSAITVKRRDSPKRTDLFAIERSQLGQERHDHRGRDTPNSGYTLQKLVVLVPRGILFQESLKLSVQFRNLLRQVLDQRLDGRPNRISG